MGLLQCSCSVQCSSSYPLYRTGGGVRDGRIPTLEDELCVAVTVAS